VAETARNAMSQDRALETKPSDSEFFGIENS
jgi:hypothetical protein